MNSLIRKFSSFSSTPFPISAPFRDLHCLARENTLAVSIVSDFQAVGFEKKNSWEWRQKR
jgi:hypothetical protein